MKDRPHHNNHARTSRQRHKPQRQMQRLAKKLGVPFYFGKHQRGLR